MVCIYTFNLKVEVRPKTMYISVLRLFITYTSVVTSEQCLFCITWSFYSPLRDQQYETRMTESDFLMIELKVFHTHTQNQLFMAILEEALWKTPTFLFFFTHSNHQEHEILTSLTLFHGLQCFTYKYASVLQSQQENLS